MLALFLFSQLLAVNFSPSHTLYPNMKTKKLNAEHIWKQLDDLLVPRLRLGPIDRAAYCYLLRHSRLERKLQLRFSMPWLARGICLGPDAASRAVRRLVDHEALRLVERSNAGHVAEVRLPEEILADLPPKDVPAGPPQDSNHRHTWPAPGVNLEEEDFLRTNALRHAIHARGAHSGNNSYRNLVSCCRECNSQKGPCRAEDFLRSLFRERKLTERELAARLRALDALAAGKLPPPLPSAAAPETPAPRASSRRARPSNTKASTTA